MPLFYAQQIKKIGKIGDPTRAREERQKKTPDFVVFFRGVVVFGTPLAPQEIKYGCI